MKLNDKNRQQNHDKKDDVKTFSSSVGDGIVDYKRKILQKLFDLGMSKLCVGLLICAGLSA